MSTPHTKVTTMALYYNIYWYVVGQDYNDAALVGPLIRSSVRWKPESNPLSDGPCHVIYYCFTFREKEKKSHILPRICTAIFTQPFP